MANEDKNFDELFRNKLSNHEVKPSSLAWERLESKLPQNKKSGYYPFLKIAASIILLLGLGYLGWFVTNKVEIESPQMAKVEKQDEKPSDEENLVLDNKEVNESKIIDSSQQEKVQEAAPETKVVKSASKQQQEIEEQASQDKYLTEVVKIEEKTEVEDLPEVVLPELDLNQSVAINEPIVESEEKEVSYKITIVSKGISDSEPEKVGLIDGIENKVEKIGGLLNKVDQGFAELQDAKNNLFASLTSKKERSK